MDKTDKTAIYPHSREYAIDKGEAEKYSKCFQTSQACAQAIDKAVNASNYELYRYDLKTAANTVIGEFGAERVHFVLANIIMNHHYDGRYSNSNKDWARSFCIEPDKYIACNSHPCILDGLVDVVRKDHMQTMAQTVGQYEKSHRIAERNRLTYFHSDFGEFVPLKNVTQARMEARYNEVLEKKAARAERRASVTEKLAAAKKAVKPPAQAKRPAKTGPDL